MRVLALVTDAFGGAGGIAHYNRAILAALCRMPVCEQVVAVPRAISAAPGALPPKLRYVMSGLGGKGRYLWAVLREGLRGRFHVIFCAHINLLPLAAALGAMLRVAVVLQVYGIEVFTPPRHRLHRWLTDRVACCLAISRETRARLLDWSLLPPERCIVLPPTYDEAQFHPGASDVDLRSRLGVQAKRVLLTVGRLSASERYKGHDRVVRVLPELLRTHPDIVYVVAGDGDDIARLKTLAEECGVTEAVRFVGQVTDERLPQLYRLADTFVMPSTGEGFGIVFLEAVASAVPAVAGCADGARDALRDGELGILVDALDPDALRDGIAQALAGPRPDPNGARCFGFDNFARQLEVLLPRVRASVGGLS